MSYFRLIPPRLRGGDALWSDGSPASDLLNAEFFAAPAAGIAGALSVREAGADAASGVGSVGVAGAVFAQETGGDSASGSGRVPVSGPLAATEPAADSVSGAGGVPVSGALAGAEADGDVAVGAARVVVAAALGVVEVGADAFGGVGSVQTSTSTGVLAVAERGADLLSIGGLVLGELRRAGPRRGGQATVADVRPPATAAERDRVPQFVRPSPSSARRPRPASYRRTA